MQKIRLTSRGKKNESATISFTFTSRLTRDHREELERLLFFNPQQNRYAAEIMQVIEDNGVPKIVMDHDVVRIRIGEKGDTHSIFALTGPPQEKLVGVILFYHTANEQITILHIAVDHEYSFGGVHADALLTFKLIEAVEHLAAKVKGVTRVGIVYGRKTGRMLYLPVRRNEKKECS